MSTSMSDTTTMNLPKRVTLPVCPPWCEGHDGMHYQGWEDAGEGRQQRNHGSEGVVVGSGLASVCVGVSQTEDGLGCMTAPVVDLYVERDGGDLTPANARLVAAALIEAADRVEANR